jgi:hypothetical protein
VCAPFSSMPAGEITTISVRLVQVRAAPRAGESRCRPDVGERRARMCPGRRRSRPARAGRPRWSVRLGTPLLITLPSSFHTPFLVFFLFSLLRKHRSDGVADRLPSPCAVRSDPTSSAACASLYFFLKFASAGLWTGLQREATPRAVACSCVYCVVVCLCVWQAATATPAITSLLRGRSRAMPRGATGSWDGMAWHVRGASHHVHGPIPSPPSQVPNAVARRFSTPRMRFLRLS